MAFSFSAPGSGRRIRSLGAMSDINVVPLVDVMLVLLIIFMLTAHVMEFGLEVNVPKVNANRASAEELPVVTITKAGELYLNERPANLNALAGDVQARFRGARSVYVRADKDTTWDPIAQVINALGTAKIEVRVVTQPADDAPSGR